MGKMNGEESLWVAEIESEKMMGNFYLEVKFQVAMRKIVYVRFKVL